MLAAILYGALILLIGIRIKIVSSPVMITPKTIVVLHFIYILVLLCSARGEMEQLIVGGLLVLLVTFSTLILRKTLIIPFNKDYIHEQIIESCRMLRIKVAYEKDKYRLNTKTGESELSVDKIAYASLLGTIRTRQPKGGDAKVVLLNKLLKKKFASVAPHITINLKKHDSN